MISASDIKKIREETGAGMLDCKKALEAADGDWDKALAWLKEKGLANAAKKADRATNEGYVASYVHTTGKIGALAELLCETDFVARNEEFRSLAGEIAMQVAAMAPENVAELLEQELVKREGVTVEEAIKQLSGKIGENMSLGRFTRLMIGE
ncbi:translation elongation factor Ts [bacterium]|nr:translation elongation factor Ts [bacterium]